MSKFSSALPVISVALILVVSGCVSPWSGKLSGSHDALSDHEPVPVPVAQASPEVLQTPDQSKELNTAELIDHDSGQTTDTEDFAVDDLWDRVRAGFQLDHEEDRARVKSQIAWFMKHPDYIERVTRRASPHLHYIVEQLESRNLPLELALLPVVESAYDPYAYSHGRASGLWQFIPATARLYDLKIDWWYDGRRDVPDATRAAATHLAALHKYTRGDWLLALAAYNMGQGNLSGAIKRNKRRGRATDFWSLKVLRETHSYVPRLLAISAIIANPEKYGVSLEVIPNEPVWEIVETGAQLDLARAAELAEMSTEELYKLNPGYNQWSTHPKGPHRLILPINKVPGFVERLDQLPLSQRVAFSRHQVRSGDTLGALASQYHTTVRTIQEANNLRGHLIFPGQSLTIPVAGADSYGEMTSAARLRNRQVSLERKLGQPPIRHQVKQGDSFWLIAKTYDVSVRELASWNGMGTTATLREGTELLVFKKRQTSDVIRKVSYRVRRGESLALIADRFNVSVDRIREWNQQLDAERYIHPGDNLTIFVDVTATE